MILENHGLALGGPTDKSVLGMVPLCIGVLVGNAEVDPEAPKVLYLFWIDHHITPNITYRRNLQRFVLVKCWTGSIIFYGVSEGDPDRRICERGGPGILGGGYRNHAALFKTHPRCLLVSGEFQLSCHDRFLRISYSSVDSDGYKRSDSGYTKDDLYPKIPLLASSILTLIGSILFHQRMRKLRFSSQSRDWPFVLGFPAGCGTFGFEILSILSWFIPTQ